MRNYLWRHKSAIRHPPINPPAPQTTILPLSFTSQLYPSDALIGVKPQKEHECVHRETFIRKSENVGIIADSTLVEQPPQSGFRSSSNLPIKLIHFFANTSTVYHS